MRDSGMKPRWLPGGCHCKGSGVRVLGASWERDSQAVPSLLPAGSTGSQVCRARLPQQGHGHASRDGQERSRCFPEPWSALGAGHPLLLPVRGVGLSPQHSPAGPAAVTARTGHPRLRAGPAWRCLALLAFPGWLCQACQVTLAALSHSQDALGRADPGAATAAHRSLLCPPSALHGMGSCLSLSKVMLLGMEPGN